jgi:type II secretory pathway component PulF
MTDFARSKPLSPDDARQLAEQLAMFTRSGLPLAPALRAAAEEMPSQHLSRAMNRLAGQLEAGQSLEDILASDPRFLPQHVQQLLIAGIRSGNLPGVFVRLVEIDRMSADLRRSVRQAMAYPLLLLVLWAVIVVAFGLWAVPQMATIYRDFKSDLPLPTQILLSISWSGVLRIVAFLTAAIPMLIYGLRVSLKSQSWQQLLSEIPLFGPTLTWRGVANWARLFALILRQNIPMREAAKLAADGVDMPLMTIAGLRIAKMVAGGRKLADAVESIPAIPASILPLIRWGEDHGGGRQASGRPASPGMTVRA